METTSVGMADSVTKPGLTPIFDELVGRYGQPLAGEPVASEVTDDMMDALQADTAVATAS
jgi:hypothetical protein